MKGEVLGNELRESFKHRFGNVTGIVIWLHVGHDQPDYSLERYGLLFTFGELESHLCSGGLLEVPVERSIHTDLYFFQQLLQPPAKFICFSHVSAVNRIGQRDVNVVVSL
uniref:Uncharacterized protein n=1 Tax=Sipha flava TaxID=143950 RepID=A0A2S2R864_9HEMI